MPSIRAPVAGLALFASIIALGTAQTLSAAEKPGPGSGMAGSNRSLGDGDKSKVAPKDQIGKSIGDATFTGTRWQLENGEPSYKISEDGTVDWATYEGFKRYHSECHTCHGPNGLGSTFCASPCSFTENDVLREIQGGRIEWPNLLRQSYACFRIQPKCHVLCRRPLYIFEGAGRWRASCWPQPCQRARCQNQGCSGVRESLHGVAGLLTESASKPR